MLQTRFFWRDHCDFSRPPFLSTPGIAVRGGKTLPIRFETLRGREIQLRLTQMLAGRCTFLPEIQRSPRDYSRSTLQPFCGAQYSRQHQCRGIDAIPSKLLIGSLRMTFYLL